jgi:hypothetical protein
LIERLEVIVETALEYERVEEIEGWHEHSQADGSANDYGNQGRVCGRGLLERQVIREQIRDTAIARRPSRW